MEIIPNKIIDIQQKCSQKDFLGQKKVLDTSLKSPLIKRDGAYI